MLNFKKRSLHALMAASALGLAACGGSSGSSSNHNGDTGTFSLAVTDAPIDMASHVFVSFSGVSIQPADGERIEFEFDEPRTIDLLALQGSASESLLNDETVPSGEYEWIRLHVNAEHDGVLDSYIEMNDGTQHELRVPSGSQTGLKLVSGFDVPVGGSADFTIDFDLRKSIVMPPGQAAVGAMLKPALRLIDNSTSGGIAGQVSSELITELCEDPASQAGSIYVFSGADAEPSDVSGEDSDPLITAFVQFGDGAYDYEVGFLAEGNYTLAYTCDAHLDDPEAADELQFVGTQPASVEAGSVTEVNFDLQ